MWCFPNALAWETSFKEHLFPCSGAMCLFSASWLQLPHGFEAPWHLQTALSMYSQLRLPQPTDSLYIFILCLKAKETGYCNVTRCHQASKGSLGRSLVLSHLTPWGRKESDTTQWLNNNNRPWINLQPDPRWSGCSPWWGGWNNIWPPTPWRGQHRYWTINTTVSVSPFWQPATNWRSITGRLKSNNSFSGALRVPPSPHPSLVKYTEIKIKSG